jgi:hypothetical protein
VWCAALRCAVTCRALLRCAAWQELAQHVGVQLCCPDVARAAQRAAAVALINTRIYRRSRVGGCTRALCSATAVDHCVPSIPLHLQATLAERRSDRTVLIVAHRLSTIMDADCIIVLKEGEVRMGGSIAARTLLCCCCSLALLRTLCVLRCAASSTCSALLILPCFLPLLLLLADCGERHAR